MWSLRLRRPRKSEEGFWGFRVLGFWLRVLGFRDAWGVSRFCAVLAVSGCRVWGIGLKRMGEHLDQSRLHPRAPNSRSFRGLLRMTQQ